MIKIFAANVKCFGGIHNLQYVSYPVFQCPVNGFADKTPAIVKEDSDATEQKYC